MNFANTPDGTLLILDMYRETIEHPESIPEPIKKHLDLTSGKERGRIYNLVPSKGAPHRVPALTKATVAQLVQLLDEPDAWWRETAQRLLIERHDPTSIALLNDLASRRPSPQARLHALCTLQVLGGLDDQGVLAGLADSEPGVREQSARLSEGFVARSPAVRDALLALAVDADAMVRFQAAFSIGAIDDDRAIGALASIAARDREDRWVRAAVLSSVGGRSSTLLTALAGRDGFFEGSPGVAWLEDLATLIGAENRPEAIRILLTLAAGPKVAPPAARAVVLGLGHGLQRSGGSLRPWLDGSDSRQASLLRSIYDQAGQIAAKPGSLKNRVEAVRLLGLGSPERALATLTPVLDAREPIELQLAVIQTLAPLSEPDVARVLLARWKALSPAARREAIEALFARSERFALVLDAIEAGQVSANDLDPARRDQLRQARDRSIRERAVRLLGKTTSESRTAVIISNRKAIELEGLAERGKRVFQQTCATCHRAQGQGVDVGPNLATVQGRSPEDLLIHILDPNREVAPVYLNYNVATSDGRVLSGVIADESVNSITLKRAEGVTDVIPRGQIEAITSTGQSLMPEGLEKGLAPQDFADLIAYLRSIQATAPGTSSTTPSR